VQDFTNEVLAFKQLSYEEKYYLYADCSFGKKLAVVVYVQYHSCVYREVACEVMFERDADETSVATLVLDALLKVCSTKTCIYWLNF
jgi:hypothetical protein